MLSTTTAPLEKKTIQYSDWQREKLSSRIPAYERVLFLDPAPIYERIGDKIDVYKRHQGLSMDFLFPKLDGKCACGCEVVPESGNTWQRKWATDNCQEFASDVLSIINNYFGRPAYYITLYNNGKKQCSECEGTQWLELDHIVAVKQGGGGCWLSNYRWLCKDCHNDKTNKDFSRKDYKPKGPQLQIDF